MKNLFELALPGGWVSLRVGDAGRLQLGRQRSPKHHNGTHMRPYLRVANVFEARIDTESVYEMNFSPKEYEIYKLSPGDLLLNEGQSKELVGRPAIYRGEVPGACFTNSLIRFHPEDGVLPEWALATFRLYLHVGVFQSVAKWTTNIAHLSANRLSGLPFRVPPPAEQQRIVDAIDSYLSRLDAAIASLERVQAKLKAYRASALKAAVEGRLVPTEAELARAEKRTYEPANALLARILKDRRRRWEEAELAKLAAAGKVPKDDKWQDKYEEPAPPDTRDLPELPQGWCWTSLGTLLAEPLRNGHSSRETEASDGIRTLTLTAVTQSDFGEHNTKRTVADAAKVADLWLKPGDILVERANTPELVGLAAMYRGHEGFAIFPDLLIRVRVMPHVDPEYIEAVLLAPASRRHFRKRAQGIAGSMPKISQATVEGLAVPLPPAAEGVRVLNEVQRLLSVTSAVATEVRSNSLRAGRLRQSVLKWAFEGKLVDQDPNDETAERLRARIRAERAATSPAENPRGNKAQAAQ